MQKCVAAAAAVFLLFFSTLFSVSAEEPEPLFPVSEQTWQYLDGNSAGQNSIAVYSLGARTIREDARASLLSALEQDKQDGYPSAVRLEHYILSLVKLGENPADYQHKDLLALLYGHENPYETGIISACGALISYDATQVSIPETAKNSPTKLVDYVVSSQHREGGFAAVSGRDPDAATTSAVLVALSPYRGTSYVDASISKALDWLSRQQAENGAFPANQPNCETTALVLTAIRTLGISAEDPRFVHNGFTLLNALDNFLNEDGGYAQTSGRTSEVAATEAVVIAFYTDAFSRPYYLSPQSYPNYVQPEQSGVKVYLRFMLNFFIIFGIIFLLLLLTNLIGKKWGGTSQTTAKQETPKPDGLTMELHIPMKADMTDFDAIYQEENQSDKNPKNPAG